MDGQGVLSLRSGEVCFLSPVQCELVEGLEWKGEPVLAGKGLLVMELSAMEWHGMVLREMKSHATRYDLLDYVICHMITNAY